MSLGPRSVDIQELIRRLRRLFEGIPKIRHRAALYNVAVRVAVVETSSQIGQVRGRALSSGAAVVIVAGLLAAVVMFATTKPADATYGDEDQFDAALIARVNEYRVSRGLDVLAVSPSLSDYARAHSEHMASQTTNCTSAGANWGHSNLSLSNPSNPAGTSAIAENINYNCGVDGYKFPVEWPNTNPNLPSWCTDPVDFTAPDKTVCDWLTSPSHLATIETPTLTHVGAGTGSNVTPADNLERWSTMVFSQSDLPLGDVSCDGRLSITDAMMIAQFETGLRSDLGSCAISNPTTQLNAGRGDMNNDGSPNIVDALIIARCMVGIISCNQTI